jgi:hypothetical protein
MAEFVRAHHRAVSRVLQALNGTLLERAECYFGGGTQLALAFCEYRESRDVDFLVSRPAGYRLLREQVTSNSLGQILTHALPLAREVRADRDGIRTFFAIDDIKVKFEILLEARIALEGAMDPLLSVPVLARQHAIAEKLLANADRGLDVATQSRDLVDLAFVAAHVPPAELVQGLAIAQVAYGDAVSRQLAMALEEFRARPAHARRCIETLGIVDKATLRKGLRALARLATQSGKARSITPPP